MELCGGPSFSVAGLFAEAGTSRGDCREAIISSLRSHGGVLRATRLLVPLSASDFYQGVRQRFPEREEMFFLPSQVTEFDRKRLLVKEVEQLQLFVNDEKSAIQWVRQQLYNEPRTYSQLQTRGGGGGGGGGGSSNRIFCQRPGRPLASPDPKKEADLEQIRNRTLLKEFQQYLHTKGKLKIV